MGGRMAITHMATGLMVITTAMATGVPIIATRTTTRRSLECGRVARPWGNVTQARARARSTGRGQPHVLWSQMSALGQKQTSRHVRVMSVIPLKADIHQRVLHGPATPLCSTSSLHPEGLHRP